MAKDTDDIAYTFTGGHERNGQPSRWHEGIPARNLTQRDVDRLDAESLKTLKASGIYEAAKPAAPKPEAKADEKKA